MTQKYFVASEGILGVRTNLPTFRWSFGVTTPEATQREYERCAVRLHLRIDRQLEPPGESLTGKYHYFRGNPGEDQIYYDRNFLFGKKLRLEATGFLTGEASIRANRTYYRWISHRMMNLHSIGYILTDLAGLLLLRRGFAPIHCSAFQTGDATVVVFAPPNTGKTLAAVMACLDHDAKFLSEDLAITDGKTLFSVPWTSTFRYYRGIDRSWTSRIRARLTSVFPPLDLISPSNPTPISDLVQRHRILPRAQATHVVILERGQPTVERLTEDEAARQIQNLNRYEFNYHKSPLVVAAEFFNPALDINGACRCEHEILRQLVASTHCLRVRVSDPTTYAKAIVDAVSGRRAWRVVAAAA